MLPPHTFLPQGSPFTQFTGSMNYDFFSYWVLWSHISAITIPSLKISFFEIMKWFRYQQGWLEMKKGWNNRTCLRKKWGAMLEKVDVSMTADGRDKLSVNMINPLHLSHDYNCKLYIQLRSITSFACGYSLMLFSQELCHNWFFLYLSKRQSTSQCLSHSSWMLMIYEEFYFLC